jgi:signal transduction histidine kinase/CheY-like chemotaxis protein
MAVTVVDGNPLIEQGFLGHDHIVQFYDTDEFLCDLVAEFLGAGLLAGEPVVAIATAAHREAFKARLADKGWDVDQVSLSGQLTLIDAAAMLGRVMDGLEAHAERIEAELGGLIDTVVAGRTGARVRMYGEMVDLLWRGGNPNAAIHLEELWNDLARKRSFSLLCAYVMGQLYQGPDIEAFNAVCRRHTHLLPPEGDAFPDGSVPAPAHARVRSMAAELAHHQEVEAALRESLRDLRRTEAALRESQRQLMRLQLVTASLSEARTQAQVLEVVATQGIGSTGALAGGIFLLGADGGSLELARGVNRTDELLGDHPPIAVDAPVPIADAFRRAAPVVVPEHAVPGRSVSLACVPVVVHARPIGVLVVAKAPSHAFDDHERAFLAALADQCAQALERARLHDAESAGRLRAEAAQRRSAFLAEASALLSSLDSEAALAALGKLAVPRIADECIVDLAPGNRLARAIRTGAAELADEPSRSTIVVPMIARGRTFGAIGFVAAAPRRRFDQADVDMAEELGRRAATALDNARMYGDALEADRRKDEFLAMLGHELRNPLAPILTALELMRLRGVGAEREQQVIEGQVKYLVHLVDDLLDVSRITRGKVDLKKEKVELATVMAQAIEMASPLVEERSHTLTADVPAEGLMVHVDPVRLRQVLGNLLTNAAKYTDPHGHIAVSARRVGGHVVISVRDDGIGIAAELLPAIFHPFVQGERILHRSQGGLGIGLTLARSLVELHGGTIAAHSAGSRQGSEFVVTLPVAAATVAPTAEPAAAATHQAAPRQSGLRVLIVDDNTDAAEVLALALRKRGYQVAVAHDGPQALATAAAFEPMTAVLDIGLPVMDGYELAKELRQRAGGRPLRLIALTGYAQPGDQERSRVAGFDLHLVKPIDLHTLMSVLDDDRAKPRSL